MNIYTYMKMLEHASTNKCVHMYIYDFFFHDRTGAVYLVSV